MEPLSGDGLLLLTCKPQNLDLPQERITGNDHDNGIHYEDISICNALDNCYCLKKGHLETHDWLGVTMRDKEMRVFTARTKVPACVQEPALNKVLKNNVWGFSPKCRIQIHNMCGCSNPNRSSQTAAAVTQACSSQTVAAVTQACSYSNAGLHLSDSNCSNLDLQLSDRGYSNSGLQLSDSSCSNPGLQLSDSGCTNPDLQLSDSCCSNPDGDEKEQKKTEKPLPLPVDICGAATVGQPCSNLTLIQQPRSNFTLIHQPRSIITLIHQPRSNLTLIQQPRSNPTLIQQPRSNLILIQQPRSNLTLVHQPRSNLTLTHQPCSNLMFP
ncbi:hypothetical protein ACRRTK_006209 [Alexandromys fortis]